MGILTHPGLSVGHGSLLVPHPSVWLETVSVKSWSINEPQAMVMWVKFGAATAFSEVPRNTVLLIVLAFSSKNGDTTDAILGPWPFWKAGGTKRTNVDPAEPCVMLHKLLHVPSNVRYIRLRHASLCLSGSQFAWLSVFKTSWTEFADEDTWRNSFAPTRSRTPRRILKNKQIRMLVTYSHD